MRGHGSVKNILSSVVDALYHDQSLAFNWAEVAFLAMWWRDEGVSDQQRQRLLHVIEAGQFCFVGGGWVQADELTPTARDQVDQTSLGQRFIESILARPEYKWNGTRVSWQLDMAGYR